MDHYDVSAMKYAHAENMNASWFKLSPSKPSSAVVQQGTNANYPENYKEQLALLLLLPLPVLAESSR